MRFPKSLRIRRSADFKRVREKGEAYRGKHLILGVLRDPDGGAFRVGFITTRRLGNAVVRNRVRRRLRTIVREVGERIRPALLLVTVAKPRAAEAEYDVLRREWKWLGHRAKIFREAEGSEGKAEKGEGG